MPYIGMTEETLGLLRVKPVSALPKANVLTDLLNESTKLYLLEAAVPDTVLDTPKYDNEQYIHSPCPPRTPATPE